MRSTPSGESKICAVERVRRKLGRSDCLLVIVRGTTARVVARRGRFGLGVAPASPLGGEADWFRRERCEDRRGVRTFSSGDEGRMVGSSSEAGGGLANTTLSSSNKAKAGESVLDSSIPRSEEGPAIGVIKASVLGVGASVADCGIPSSVGRPSDFLARAIRNGLHFRFSGFSFRYPFASHFAKYCST